MQRDTTTGERMLGILLNGVSTRRYQRVIPEMTDTAGVSNLTVSREAIEASEAPLKQLMERRFDKVELLIIYVDGMKFQDQCVLAAVGVDVEGRKHVLALREGATENAEAAKDLSTWSSTASIPRAGVCSPSTARKLCASRRMPCLAPRHRSNGVGTTSFATCWGGYRASSKHRRLC
jgi:hypothetical protein